MPRKEDVLEKKMINLIQKDKRYRCFKTKSESTTLPIGYQDLMIFNRKDNLLHFVELKRDTNKPQPIQLAGHKVGEENTGCKTHIVYESNMQQGVANLLRGDYD